MSFSHLRHEVSELAGELAVTYPETWAMSWAYLGLLTGVLLYAGLGWWLGGLASHSLVGMWCGLGFYGYWLAVNAERINDNINVVVNALKSLK